MVLESIFHEQSSSHWNVYKIYREREDRKHGNGMLLRSFSLITAVSLSLSSGSSSVLMEKAGLTVAAVGEPTGFPEVSRQS